MKLTAKYTFRIIITLIALFGTLGRIILSQIDDPNMSILFYFTIQSNLMVCFYLVSSLIPGAFLQKWPSEKRESLNGALLLYILITGIVFNVLLAKDVQSGGIGAVILHINHTATPILFLTDWLLQKKQSIQRIGRNTRWLLYPVCYAVFGTIEGSITQTFRYPFLDFTQPPMQYAVGLCIVVAAFLLLGYVITLLHNARYIRNDDK